MERGKSIHVMALVVWNVFVLIELCRGSPFPDASPQPFHQAWHMQGHHQVFRYGDLTSRLQNQNPPTVGNGGNCYQMNIPCSGHTQASCEKYCSSVGFPYGVCDGSCCLCETVRRYGVELQAPELNQGYSSSPFVFTNNMTWMNYPNVISTQQLDPADFDLETSESIRVETHKLKSPYQEKPPNTYHSDALERTKETSSKGKVCQTEGCSKAARRLSFNMDRSVNPCVNFYEYACGGFIKKTQIPEDETEVTPFTELRNKVAHQLRVVYEEPVRANDPYPFVLTKNLYKSCMNEGLLNRLGLSPIKNVVEELGGWPVLLPADAEFPSETFTWYSFMAWLRDFGFLHDIFLKISVEPDIKSTQQRVITIGEPILNLPQEVLVHGMNDASVNSYFRYMKDTAILFGADQFRAESEMRKVLSFEMSLARIFHRPSAQRASTYYVPITVAELETKLTSIPWFELLKRILPASVSVSRQERMVLTAPHYLEAFIKLMQTVDTKTLGNYAIWRAVSSSMAFLNEPARRLQFKFVAQTTGQEKRLPRWRECTDMVSLSMGNAAGAMYVRKYFPSSAKFEAEQLVNNIHKAFLKILGELDWMDDYTRGKAREKALNLAIHVGYPQEHMNDALITQIYQSYNFSAEDYLGNIRDLVVEANNIALEKLREAIKKDDWVMFGKNAQVNAFYMPLNNAMQFPAGILQNPFFDNSRPRYMNYGAIGWIAGHEITHGFDDQGHNFDKNGNYANWWDPFTKKTYLTKTRCIIDQYSGYRPREMKSLKLDGMKSQGENVADNGGIKQAYRAYQNWVEKNGRELPLPGFEEFSLSQLFWLAAASNWCSIHRPEKLRSNVVSGVHSPGEFRVIGAFSNSPEFARDFSCPAGSPMNPVSKCRVW